MAVQIVSSSLSFSAGKGMILLSVFIACLCCFSVCNAQTNNILVLSPFTTPSHSNFIRPIVMELVNRGHSVTYWNGLKPDKDVTIRGNLRQLYSKSIGELHKKNGCTFSDRGRQFYMLFTVYGRMVNACQALYWVSKFQTSKLSTGMLNC